MKVYFLSQSLQNRAGSFDHDYINNTQQESFNPFGTGQGLSTFIIRNFTSTSRFNPFGTGRGISTFFDANHCKTAYEFQSLWSRAGSFDTLICTEPPFLIRVSIPLEQGRVLRQKISKNTKLWFTFQSLWSRAGSFDLHQEYSMSIRSVSIPLEQGGVFRREPISSLSQMHCFNPFGTGRCLSTLIPTSSHRLVIGLNPFGTGQGLSTQCVRIKSCMQRCLNPFRTGRGLSTQYVSQNPETIFVSIPLEQGRVFRHLFRFYF